MHTFIFNLGGVKWTSSISVAWDILWTSASRAEMEFPDYSQDMNFLSSGGDSDRFGSCVRAAFSLKMLLTRRHIHTVFSGAINTMTSMKSISIPRFSFHFFLSFVRCADWILVELRLETVLSLQWKNEFDGCQPPLQMKHSYEVSRESVQKMKQNAVSHDRKKLLSKSFNHGRWFWNRPTLKHCWQHSLSQNAF